MDQICVLRIIQVFPCMHIFVSFCAFAYFREFLHVQPPQSCDSLNLISESIDNIPSSVNKHCDFHIPHWKHQHLLHHQKIYSLKAFLDNGNIIGVELFAVSLVDQTHQ